MTRIFIDPAVGLKGSDTDCPVGIAIKRAFNTEQVEIYGSDMAFIKGKPYLLPPPVSTFIQRHDRGERVVDFSSVLEPLV